ncbi:MAG TPA: LytTR family DNA-binding domain-containing protein [Bacteroidales bacterium]|nr:LytTR family DNA-binding domain-containing protein [Bacteroidales bacterium]
MKSNLETDPAMRHPAFQNLPRQILYLSLCILTGLALTLCQLGLVPVSAVVLMLDGLVLGILAGLLAYLLWFVVFFADLSGRQPMQRIVNHSALLVLLLTIWVGGGFLLEMLLFPASVDILSKALPLKTVFGLLLFMSVVRLYQDWKREKDFLDDEITELPASKPVVPNKYLETISVKSGQKIHLVQVSDILFLQAEGDYVLIHTAEGKFLKEQTMKYFQENLPAERFIRIHRSCIVHADCISKIELYEKQNYRITLKSGQQLKASAGGYKQLKSALSL